MDISETPLIDATRLAIKEINDAGGINGRPINAFYENTLSDANSYALKARKLINENKVCCIFGCWTSASRKAVLPVIEEEKNLLWYPIQYEGGELSNRIIYTGQTPNQQIFPALDWCLEKKQCKNFFLVGSDYVFPRRANGLIKTYLADKAHISGEEYVPLEEPDFSQVVQIIAAAKPEMIFNTVNGKGNNELFMALNKNVATRGIPVISVSIAEEEVRRFGTQCTVNNYCCWSYFQSVNSIKNDAFINLFKGDQPTKVTSDPIQTAYTQVFLFAEAAKKCSLINADEILEHVTGVTWDSPGGPVEICANRHLKKRALIGRINAAGQFDIIWRSKDAIIPAPFEYYGTREKMRILDSLESVLAAGTGEFSSARIRDMLKSPDDAIIEIGLRFAQHLAPTGELAPQYLSLLAHENPLIVQSALDLLKKVYDRQALLKHVSTPVLDLIRILPDHLNDESAGVKYRTRAFLTALCEQAAAQRAIEFKDAIDRVNDLASNEDSPFTLSQQKAISSALKDLRNDSADMATAVSILSIPWVPPLLLIMLIFAILPVLFFVYPYSMYWLHKHLKSFNGNETFLSRSIFRLFSSRDRVLNSWVRRYHTRACVKFKEIGSVKDRREYVAAPVFINGEQFPSFTKGQFNEIRKEDRWCLHLFGDGGTGKTSLAFQIASWCCTPSDSKFSGKNLLTIPVLLEPQREMEIKVDTLDEFLSRVQSAVSKIIGEEGRRIPHDFLIRLLEKQHILVVADDIAVLNRKGWSLVNVKDFPVCSLIVTSRSKDVLGDLNTLGISPLKITTQNLKAFVIPYLQFKPGQHSDGLVETICEYLRELIGPDPKSGIPALFAKLYIDELVNPNTQKTHLSLPEIVNKFVDNLTRNLTNQTDPRKEDVGKVLYQAAWICCRENLFAEPFRKDSVSNPLTSDIIDYLTDDLRILYRDATSNDILRFALDPMAEYFAAFHLVREYGSDQSKWQKLLSRFTMVGIAKTQSRGLLKAIDEVIRGKEGSNFKVPQGITDQFKDLVASKQSQPIKIGLLHSTSGTMAISEGELQWPIELAVEEINKAGGLLKRELVIERENPDSDDEKFKSMATKLIDQGVVSVFGCWTSASRRKVKDLFEERNNLLWYPVQYEGGESSPNIIYGGATPNQQLFPALDWLLAQGKRKFFMVGSDYVFPTTANALMRKHLEKFNLEPCGEKYLDLDHKDFMETVSLIAQAQPDAILNTLNGKSNTAFFRTLRKQGITPETIPVMSFSIAEVEIREIGADLVAGNFCAWSYFQSVDTPENIKFCSMYKDEHPTKVVDDPIEMSYTQVKLFAKAVEEANTTEPDEIKKALKKITLISPRGEIHVTADNHLQQHSYIGKIKSDGQFEIVDATYDIAPDPYKYHDEIESAH